jgi:hypothetical protein
MAITTQLTNKTDLDSFTDKLNKEIEQVKSHALEGKKNLHNNNYSEALYHLRLAESTSTCSYCKNKLQEAIFDVEYNKNICDIGSKNCTINKDQISSKIDEFITKLPDITDIRKNKALTAQKSNEDSFDPFNSIYQSLNMVTSSLNTMISNIFKF